MLLGTVVAVVPPVGPGMADGGSPVGLGIDSYADLVVDSAHGRIFVSSGRNGSGVRVTDLSGGSQTTIPDLPGAAGMALSPDGSTLHVALIGAGVIAAIDTTTLTETRRHSIGSGTCPTWLTPAGGKLYFGYGCVFGKGMLGSLDVSGQTPVVALGLPLDRVPVSPPLLRSSPAAPNLLVVADRSTSSSPLSGSPAVYDVSSGTPARVAALSSETCSGLNDVALTSDAGRVILACNFLTDRTAPATEHAAFATTDLSAAGRYPSGSWPTAVTASPDGAFVVVGATDRTGDPKASAVHVRRPDGSLVHRYDLPAGRYLERQGLAVTADGSRLVAVTTDEGGRQPALHVFTDFDLFGASLALSAPSSIAAGPVTVSGRLSFHGGTVSHPQVLQVSRRDSAGTRRLPDVTTAADGAFSLSDLPTAPWANTYTVSRPGDTTHAAVSRSVTVSVLPVASSITLTVRPASAPGGRHMITGVLSFTDAAVSTPWTLQLVRQDSAGAHALPAVVTGPTGAFSFPVTDPSSTYVVTFPGDAVRLGSSRSVTVRFVRTLKATRVGVGPAAFRARFVW
ncbi:hypothetical protein O7606_21610 [Micromonospora sp. WMMD882]|uniref:YncE family protein n=1 Tax=Micromonospora sp. WMMD882 TaxID=3015151 RepID=UPI00248AC634|nr:hypothetical protein [Micromonospora sp. WMMD882]WBB78780.1 hypothetical protein O7606_21610 [Micromonospora sp. WMMD882]